MPERLPDDVRQALADGRKVDAIRLLRQARGIGLKQAKGLVDASRPAAARALPKRRPGLAPGEVPRGRSGPILLALMAALLALLGWRLLAGP